MQLIATIRRIAEAIITAVGVVVGLTPDPTRIPVPVRVDRNPTYRR
jgi:hypothetical protein